MNDYDDVTITIVPGHSVRRALIRRFTAALQNVLIAEGRDPTSCTEIIEVRAWKLADQFIADMIENLEGNLDAFAPVMLSGETAQDGVRLYVEDTVDEFMAVTVTENPTEMDLLLRAADHAPERKLAGVPFLRTVKD